MTPQSSLAGVLATVYLSCSCYGVDPDAVSLLQHSARLRQQNVARTDMDTSTAEQQWFASGGGTPLTDSPWSYYRNYGVLPGDLPAQGAFSSSQYPEGGTALSLLSSYVDDASLMVQPPVDMPAASSTDAGDSAIVGQSIAAGLAKDKIIAEAEAALTPEQDQLVADALAATQAETVTDAPAIDEPALSTSPVPVPAAVTSTLLDISATLPSVDSQGAPSTTIDPIPSLTDFSPLTQPIPEITQSSSAISPATLDPAAILPASGPAPLTLPSPEITQSSSAISPASTYAPSGSITDSSLDVPGLTSITKEATPSYIPAGSNVTQPAMGGCTPQCAWQCEQQVCDEVCKPKCQAPTCETRCFGHDLSACSMDCQQPSCATICPQRSCPGQGCPLCQTTCGDPKCMLNCPKEQPCKTICEQPKCEWECMAPTVCPKPKCQMVCQSPRHCGGSTAVALPALRYGETSVKHFTPSLPSSATAATNAVDTSAGQVPIQAPISTQSSVNSIPVPAPTLMQVTATIAPKRAYDSLIAPGPEALLSDLREVIMTVPMSE